MEEISNIEDIMPRHSYIGSIATIFPLTNRFVYRKYSTLVMGDLLSALIWGKSRGPKSDRRNTYPNFFYLWGSFGLGMANPPKAENDKTVSMAPLGLLNEDVKTADSHIDGIDIGCFTQSGS